MPLKESASTTTTRTKESGPLSYLGFFASFFLPEKEWVKGIKGEINEDKMEEGRQRQRRVYNYGKEVVGGMGMMV